MMNKSNHQTKLEKQKINKLAKTPGWQQIHTSMWSRLSTAGFLSGASLRAKMDPGIMVNFSEHVVGRSRLLQN